MKKTLIVLAVILASVVTVALQSSKQITLSWDPIQPESAPVANTTEIRLYDISTTPETLLGVAPCSDPPAAWACPTTLTITVPRRQLDIVARAWNGEWESANSNVVIQPGPPKEPGNVRKR